MKVKKEVRELCVKLIEALHSENNAEFKRIENILKRKWKFNTWNLLALFGSPRTIEVNPENRDLVCEV